MPKLRTDMIVCHVVRQVDNQWQVLQLLRRRDDYMGGTWQFCSGKVEAGETALTAALRELREETSLRPVEMYQLSYVEPFFIAKTDTIWLRAGFVAVVDADQTVVLDEEHEDYRWVDQEAIESLLTWPSEKVALAEIFAETLADPPGLAAEHRRVELPPIVS